MVGFGRSKRVTDPLDDKAKARLVGDKLSYFSSGSEHSSSNDSPCLSELVHSFLEQDDSQTQSRGYESDSDQLDSVSDNTDSVTDVVTLSVDPRRNLILSHVLKAMEVFSCVRNEKSVYRRKVMSFLREAGYNAAICKTKWGSSTNLTAGSYEFIDILTLQLQSATNQTRYVVDLEFASQFEIARPTAQYSRLLQSLPRVFVGKTDELKKIVKVMCDSARRSLKSRELSLSPWRKNRYMQNKWFGPYRRTVNPVPVNSLAPSVCSVNVVSCRIGFDDAVSGGFFVRTR